MCTPFEPDYCLTRDASCNRMKIRLAGLRFEYAALQLT